MASKYVTDLRTLGEELLLTGFPVSSATCLRGATHMEEMENYIVALNEAEVPADDG